MGWPIWGSMDDAEWNPRKDDTVKDTFTQTLRLLRYNWRALLLFEVVYRAVLIALVGPVFKLALDGSMAIAGFPYLTHENVKHFLSHPAVVVVSVLVGLCFAIYELLDIAALHYILGQSVRGDRAHSLDAFHFAVGQLVKPRNLPLLVLVLLVVPLLSIGTILGVVFSMETPEMVFEHLNRYRPIVTVVLIAIAVAIVLLFRLMFTFAYAFFDGDGFAKSVGKSWRAGRHHSIGDLFSVLIMQILLWVACFCVIALVAVPLGFLVPTNFAGTQVSRQTVVVFFAVIPAAVAAGLLANAPSSVATMLARLSLRADQIDSLTMPASLEHLRHRGVLRAASVGLAVVCLAWGAHHLWTTTLGPIYEFKHDGHEVLVTAHRGGGAHAPENTLAAFEQASKDNAWMCELDVQMSKDGKVFVSHDSTFQRISGVQKAAWDLTYDEILKLDATGKKWEGSFEKQHYPLLDEVLDWADKAGMPMNIELKPTGHETDFEQAVVDIVHAHDFSDRCIVTSQVYKTVENVKKCDPAIECVYVSRFVYGDIYKMEAADIFSIEENSARPALVASLVEHDKGVLAWTINARRGIERAVINGVDSVITDDVPMAQEVIAQMKG